MADDERPASQPVSTEQGSSALSSLKSEGGSWTLQSDAHLLKYLQNFSSSLITRT